MTKENSRRLLFVAIPAGFFLLYCLARWTGAFNFYRIPTTAMEPNYPAGSVVFSSNWVTPERNDAVVYRDSSLAIPGLRASKEEIYLGRLIAQAGDVLEIKNGHTYINGTRSDEGLRLLFGWTLSAEDYHRNQAFFKDVKPENINTHGNLVVVYLDENEAERIRQGIPAMQRSEQKLEVFGGPNIWGEGAADWTLDDFGPVTVPPGEVFILGDNRHNSEDSRYRGFVPADQVMAKLIR